MAYTVEGPHHLLHALIVRQQEGMHQASVEVPVSEYKGDFAAGAVVNLKFATVNISPMTLLSGAVAVYRDNSLVQTTTGVTLTVDFDGLTGSHHVRIDTSADSSFFVAGDFNVVLTAGTVGGLSVAGLPVGSFSIGRTDALLVGDVTSPVDSDTDEITIVRGDDYNVSDGSSREIAFEDANFPTLTGLTITCTFRSVDDDKVLFTPVTATVVSASRFRIPLTAAQTVVMPVGEQSVKFDCETTYNTRKWTLARGFVTVYEDQTR